MLHGVDVDPCGLPQRSEMVSAAVFRIASTSERSWVRKVGHQQA